MPIFCGATLQFDEAGLQRISVNSSRENIRHFSALIIFSMQLKVPQVKLYYQSAASSVDPQELRGRCLRYFCLSLRVLGEP